VSSEWSDFCHVSYTTNKFKTGLFNGKRANMETVLNIYDFIKKETQEAKKKNLKCSNISLQKKVFTSEKRRWKRQLKF
jgi:hypothetical protein